MPIRSRSHILEELSIQAIRAILPSQWVYRNKAPDYGIDGEVELFDSDGTTTGLSFFVQLRATDDASRADSVRLKVDSLAYYNSFDVPTMVVRYDSTHNSFYWQWSSNINAKQSIADGRKTLTYRFSESERWTENTAEEIQRTLLVRREISQFPAGKAVPISVDLSQLPEESRYDYDRAVARVISESRGTLSRASQGYQGFHVKICAKPDFLGIYIDTIGSVTFGIDGTKSDKITSSILYSVALLFQRNKLNYHAEIIARALADGKIAHVVPELAFHACLALVNDLPALVRLVVVNGLHNELPYQAFIAKLLVKTPQDEARRAQALSEYHFASLASARERGKESEAAATYSIGNTHRARGDLAKAISYYNQARHLRPAYLLSDYFIAELAGALCDAGRFGNYILYLAGRDSLYVPRQADTDRGYAGNVGGGGTGACRY